MLSERDKDISTRLVFPAEQSAPLETNTVLEEIIAGTLPPDRMEPTLLTIAQTILANPTEGWEMLEYLQFCGQESPFSRHQLEEAISNLGQLLRATDRPPLASLDQLPDHHIQRMLYLADVSGRIHDILHSSEDSPKKRKKAPPEETFLTPVIEEFISQIDTEEKARQVLSHWKPLIKNLSSDHANHLYSTIKKQHSSLRFQRRRQATVKALNKVLLPVAGTVAGAAWGAPAVSDIPWPARDPMLVSAFSGFAAGSIPRILPFLKGKPGFFKGLNRVAGNVGLATLTAAQIAQSIAPPTVDQMQIRPQIEQAYSDRTDEQTDELARAILTNPSAVPDLLASGQMRLSDIDYALTVPVLENTGTISRRTALPIRFVDEVTGEVLYEYRRTIYEPVTSEDVPPRALAFLDALEGLSAEDEVLDEILGDTPITSTDEFIARLVTSNLSPDTMLKLLRGEKPEFERGGSQVPVQLAKEIYGYRNSRSLVNPEIPNTIYDEERYAEGLAYAWELYRALRDGEVIDPTHLKQRAAEDRTRSIPPALAENTMQEVLFTLIEQMERRLAGRFIENQPDYAVTYARMIRMGAVVPVSLDEEEETPGVGTEIFGLPGAARYLFNKPLAELSDAELAMVVMAIPRAQDTWRAFAADKRDEPEALAGVMQTFENVIHLLQRKNIITPVEAVRMRVEGERILNDGQYTLAAPEEFLNTWLHDGSLPPGVNSQIEAYLSVTPQLLAVDPNITLTRRGVEVSINFESSIPLLTERQTIDRQLASVDIEEPFTQDLEQLINSRLELREQGGVPYYSYRLSTRKEIRLPVFEYAEGQYLPGLQLVITDTNGEVVAHYDPAGTRANAVIPASVIKGPLYAIARLSGDVPGPDAQISGAAGPFAFSPNITVQNANGRQVGTVTWSAALGESLNVPFARWAEALVERNVEGATTNEARNSANFIHGIQEPMERLFGMRFTDIHGQPITSPTDPDQARQALTFAYGSEVYVKGTGFDGGLADLARAYARFTDPERFTSNPAEIAVFREVARILERLGASVPGWQSMAKTGTHEGKTADGQPITSSLLTVLSMHEERSGNNYQIGVLVRGQEITPEGRVQNLDLDRASQLAGVGAESFVSPLPIAQDLAGTVAELSGSSFIPAQEVEQMYEALRTAETPELTYRIQGVAPGTPLFSLNRTPLGTVDQPILVDAIGEPQNGFQQVIFADRRNRNTMAFVPAESLLEMKDFLTAYPSQVELEVMNISGLPPGQITVMDDRNRSPFLQRLNELQDFSLDIAPGTMQFGDLLQNAGLSDVLLVNPNRLEDYLGGDRSATTEALLVRDLRAEQELRAIDALFSEALPGMTLNSWIGNNRRLQTFIYLLSHQPDQFDGLLSARLIDTADPDYLAYGRLGDIVLAYQTLVTATQVHEPSTDVSRSSAVTAFIEAVIRGQADLETIFLE